MPQPRIRQALEVAPGPIDAVLGGFHLGEVRDDQVRSILGAFRVLGVSRAGPTHGSGEGAMEIFRESYGDGFLDMGAGRVLRFLM